MAAADMWLPWELQIETTGERCSAETPRWLAATLATCVRQARPFRVVGLRVMHSGAGKRRIKVPLDNGVQHVEIAAKWLTMLLARLSPQQSTAAVRWALEATQRRAQPIEGVVRSRPPDAAPHKLVTAVVPPSPLPVTAHLEDWVGAIITSLPAETRSAIFAATRDVRFVVEQPGHHGMRLDMPARFGGPRAN